MERIFVAIKVITRPALDLEVGIVFFFARLRLRHHFLTLTLRQDSKIGALRSLSPVLNQTYLETTA
jgi:hypothetical protein